MFGERLGRALALCLLMSGAVGEAAWAQNGDAAFWERLRAALNRAPQGAKEAALSDASRSRVDVARSRLLPRVDFHATGGVVDGPMSSDPLASERTRVMETKLTIEQSLVDVGAWRSWSAASVGVDERVEAKAWANQSLAREMLVACASVVAARGKHAIAAELEKAAADQQNAMRQRAKAGELAMTRHKQAAMQASSFTARRLNAEGELAAALERYRELFGSSPPDALVLPSLDDLVTQIDDKSVEDLLRAHPARLAAGLAATRGEREASAREWAHAPVLSLSAEASRVRENDVEAAPSMGINLNLRVPIFAGGQTSAESFGARAQAATARAEETERVARLTTALSVARVQHRLSKSVAEATASARGLSREMLDAAREEFRLGAGSQSLIFDALRNAMEEQMTAAAAGPAAWMATVDYLWAAGRLDATLAGGREARR